MTKKLEIKSCLLPPGTMFEVNEHFSNNTIPRGTTGFISIYNNYKGYDFLNVSVAIIRKGRTGMARLDYTQMNVIPFYFPENKELIKDIKGRNKGITISALDKVQKSSINLLDMPALEFVGWACAYANFLSNLKGRYVDLPIWPSKAGHPLNEMKNANHAQSMLKNEFDKFSAIYASPEKREEFAGIARKFEANMSRVIERDFGASMVSLKKKGLMRMKDYVKKGKATTALNKFIKEQTNEGEKHYV